MRMSETRPMEMYGMLSLVLFRLFETSHLFLRRKATHPSGTYLPLYCLTDGGIPEEVKDSESEVSDDEVWGSRTHFSTAHQHC